MVQKVDQHIPKDKDPSEWNVRPLCDWVNLNFPIGLPEDQILKIADRGQDLPLPGSLFDGLSAAQFAVAQHVSRNAPPSPNVLALAQMHRLFPEA